MGLALTFMRAYGEYLEDKSMQFNFTSNMHIFQ